MEPQNTTNQPPADPVTVVSSVQQPKNKKQLILSLVIAAAAVSLILVAGGVFWYLHRGSSEQASNSESSASEAPNDYDNSDFTTEVTTTIRGGNFTPATLTIAPHTRVNWQNSDSSNHWLTLNDSSQKDGPAASEDNDPRLPTRNEIAAGGGYAHVFEKADTYVFHLIDQPTVNITIIVK